MRKDLYLLCNCVGFSWTPRVSAVICISSGWALIGAKERDRDVSLY